MEFVEVNGHLRLTYFKVQKIVDMLIAKIFLERTFYLNRFGSLLGKNQLADHLKSVMVHTNLVRSVTV